MCQNTQQDPFFACVWYCVFMSVYFFVTIKFWSLWGFCIHVWLWITYAWCMNRLEEDTYPLKLGFKNKLWPTLWMLEIKIVSLGRAIGALNCWAIAPIPWDTILGWGEPRQWWYTPLIPALRIQSRDRWNSVNSRPAWSTEQILWQAPKLQRNPVSENKNKKMSFRSQESRKKQPHWKILSSILLIPEPC